MEEMFGRRLLVPDWCLGSPLWLQDWRDVWKRLLMPDRIDDREAPPYASLTRKLGGVLWFQMEEMFVKPSLEAVRGDVWEAPSGVKLRRRLRVPLWRQIKEIFEITHWNQIDVWDVPFGAWLRRCLDTPFDATYMLERRPLVPNWCLGGALRCQIDVWDAQSWAILRKFLGSPLICKNEKVFGSRPLVPG